MYTLDPFRSGKKDKGRFRVDATSFSGATRSLSHPIWDVETLPSVLLALLAKQRKNGTKSRTYFFAFQ